jgi:hypothetical protein
MEEQTQGHSILSNPFQLLLLTIPATAGNQRYYQSIPLQNGIQEGWGGNDYTTK